jgi:PAS domain S-box-containing protein
MPESLGLWLATSAALGLALATTFAYWLGGAARRAVHDTLFGEWDAARQMLVALPEGLLVVHEGRIRSVNRRLCEMLGFERDELLGAVPPFPFWAPEHRHEIEAWFDELEQLGQGSAALTFRHADGERLRVLVSGQTFSTRTGAQRRLVAIRDVTADHRRERRLAEIASRDPDTGLLNQEELERRLAEAVRRAVSTGGNVTVVLASISLGGKGGGDGLRRPDALLAVDRLSATLRSGDLLGRTAQGELAWILPDTDMHGGVGAVARARTELACLEGVALTVGICDLATARDGLAVYAFAGHALDVALRRGVGATVQYASQELAA